MTDTSKLFIDFDARLDRSNGGAKWPDSWFITHRLGGAAAGTYTEVAFDSAPADRAVAEEIVRRVAVDLYGTAWAFHYRPEAYEDAIGRWAMRCRERVIVSGIEVFER